MTPKQKATELVNKFINIKSEKGKCKDPIYTIFYVAAKECAYICVDEIYNNLTDANKNDYWVEVHSEIGNL